MSMQRGEFNKKYVELLAQKRALINQMRELENEYLNANRQYNDGEIVTIEYVPLNEYNKTLTGKFFVNKAAVWTDEFSKSTIGDISYFFNKIKSDGTMSTHKLYYERIVSITKQTI